jgi:hypothetical protein
VKRAEFKRARPVHAGAKKYPAVGAVLVMRESTNRKLSPVEMVDVGMERKRPYARRPFVSSSFLPVNPTCPRSCPFRGNGCMAETGYTGRPNRKLEAVARDLELTATDAAIAEAHVIDRLFPHGVPRDGGRDGQSPRDFRLHVSGDVGGVVAARALGDAVARWKARGGGSAWTFTHAWKRVHRRDFGPISVLASVESRSQVEAVRERGYAPAITVDSFYDSRAFELWPGAKWIPCPAELGKTTCVECRLCLDRTDWMRETGRGIAFAVHGPGAESAKRKLRVVS